jgi:hypothetical protein
MRHFTVARPRNAFYGADRGEVVYAARVASGFTEIPVGGTPVPRQVTSPCSPSSLPQAYPAASIGDADGDGDADLAIAYCGAGMLIELAILPGSTGGLGPAPIASVSAGTFAQIAAAGDFDDDGLSDIALLGDGEPLTIHRGPDLEVRSSYRVPNAARVGIALAGDPDRDGRPDIAVVIAGGVAVVSPSRHRLLAERADLTDCEPRAIASGHYGFGTTELDVLVACSGTAGAQIVRYAGGVLATASTIASGGRLAPLTGWVRFAARREGTFAHLVVTHGGGVVTLTANGGYPAIDVNGAATLFAEAAPVVAGSPSRIFAPTGGEVREVFVDAATGVVAMVPDLRGLAGRGP